MSIKTSVPWNDARIFEPSNHQMCLIVTPTSQRGSIDYGFKDMGDGKWKVQTSIGWGPVSDYGSEVTHWYPLRDFVLPLTVRASENG